MVDGNVYDLRAGGWDTPRRMARAEAVAGRIARALDGHGYRTAMEFGCGTGLISFALPAMFDEVTLVDTSPGMIDAVRRKAAERGAAHMRPVVRDIAAAPYDARFDCVYSSMVMHHIDDVPDMLARLRGALRPGGMLCVVDLDPVSRMFHLEETEFIGHDGFAHDRMRGMMADEGLTGVRIETFFHDAKAVGGESVPYSLFCATGVRSV